MTILNANIHGLYQGFRTGSNARDFRLTSISLYVGDTHESRFMTVDAGLYRGDRDDLRHARLSRVATLTRSGFDDYAHNSWQAPAHTYLEPDTHYYLVLRCEAGCANDNRVQFGMTRSAGEDPGAKSGWSIHDRLGYLRAGADRWKLDDNEALRMRVNGRPGPDRAYAAEIISTPADGHTYRRGENIDIYLKFTTEVSAVWESVIGIRVGDATDGSNYRAARSRSRLRAHLDAVPLPGAVRRHRRYRHQRRRGWARHRPRRSAPHGGLQLRDGTGDSILSRPGRRSRAPGGRVVPGCRRGHHVDACVRGRLPVG